MTQEQKAIAYDEAIERAKKFHTPDSNNSNLKAVLELIFPKLAENEDERIRKSLIRFLTDIKEISESGRTTWAVRKEDAEMCKSSLAYLEKQKKLFESGSGLYYYDGEKTTYLGYPSTEENPYDFAMSQQEEQMPITNVFGFKVGDKVRLKDGDGRTHIIKSFEEVEGLHGPNFYHVEFEDNSARDGIYPGEEYPNGYYTQMEKIEEEQKQEWSEEDEKRLEDAIEIIDEPQKPIEYDHEMWKNCEANFEGGKKEAINGGQKECEQWDKLQEEFRNINEAFEDGRKEVVAHPKKYGLCEPVEWSEEDEEHLKSIISTLEMCMKDCEDAKAVIGYYESDINWLKSLHPQPKREWTDDDEQHLKWLCRIIHSRKNHGELSLTEESELGNWIDKWINHNPQSHWKPSEEQMEALERASTNEYLSAKQFDILVSLYEQLKKL